MQRRTPPTVTAPKLPQTLTLCDVRLLFSIRSSAWSVTFESSPWIRSRDCWAWIKDQKVPLVNNVAWSWTHISSVIKYKWAFLPYTGHQPPFASRSLLSPAWTESQWAGFSTGIKNRHSTHVLHHIIASQRHLWNPFINVHKEHLFRASCQHCLH